MIKISGKQALNAVLDGVQVEYCEDGEWDSLNKYIDDFGINDFRGEKFEFRIKESLVIQKAELPAPFHPEIGERYWIPLSYSESGHDNFRFGDSDKNDRIFTQFGTWRTKEEAEIVVEFLRSVFSVK